MISGVASHQLLMEKLLAKHTSNTLMEETHTLVAALVINVPIQEAATAYSPTRKTHPLSSKGFGINGHLEQMARSTSE